MGLPVRPQGPDWENLAYVMVSYTRAPLCLALSSFLLTFYTTDFGHYSDSRYLQKSSDDSAIVGYLNEWEEVSQSLLQSFLGGARMNTCCSVLERHSSWWLTSDRAESH